MEASRAETRTGLGGAATAAAIGAGAAATVEAALAAFPGAAVAVTEPGIAPFFATVAVVLRTAGLTCGGLDDFAAVLVADDAAALAPGFAADLTIGLTAGFAADFLAGRVAVFAAAFGRAGAGTTTFLRAGAAVATVLVAALAGALALTTAFFTLTFAIGFLVGAFTVCLLGKAAAAWGNSASTEPLRRRGWRSAIMRFIPSLSIFEDGGPGLCRRAIVSAWASRIP